MSDTQHPAQARFEAKIHFFRWLVIYVAACGCLAALNAIFWAQSLWSLWPVGVGAVLLTVKGLRTFRVDPWDMSTRRQHEAEEDAHRGMRQK